MKFLWWMRSPLFDAAGDGAGSGGGSGDGAGAGTSGAGSFDPVAFKTELKNELLGEVNKTINGFGKTLKNDFTKLFEGLKPTPAAGAGAGSGAGEGAGAGAGGGSGEGAGAGSGSDPKLNAVQLELKREREQAAARIKALEDKFTASETEKLAMARDKALGDALGKFEFMSPEAKNTAIQLFKSQVQRTEDGEFVAGELPLEKFIETELPAKHGYLLKAKDVGGAGARPGRGSGGKKWDLTTVLEPATFSKLSPAEQAEVRQQVALSL